MDIKDIKINESIKGVLLDFDNTFYSYKPCHEAALEKAWRRLENEYKWTKNEFIDKYQQAQVAVKKIIPTQAASHSRLLYFKSILESVGQSNNFSLMLELDELYWSEFISKITLNETMLNMVEKWRGVGMKICIVTDLLVSVQLLKFRELNLGKYFDLIVTSEEVGVEKPDVKIFQYALSKLGLEPSEVIMIGDDSERDGAGCAKLCIKYYSVL